MTYSHENTPTGYLPCTREDGHDGPCALPAALSATNHIVEVTCEEAGCAGCGYVHRKIIGRPTYTFGDKVITEAEYWAEISRRYPELENI